MSEIQRGTQIAYIPEHAEGDLKHPNVEFGFVTSIRNDIAFCRFWSRFSPDELRTKANSEATPIEHLVVSVTKPQRIIKELLEVYATS